MIACPNVWRSLLLAVLTISYKTLPMGDGHPVRLYLVPLSASLVFGNDNNLEQSYDMIWCCPCVGDVCYTDIWYTACQWVTSLRFSVSLPMCSILSNWPTVKWACWPESSLWTQVNMFLRLLFPSLAYLTYLSISTRRREKDIRSWIHDVEDWSRLEITLCQKVSDIDISG